MKHVDIITYQSILEEAFFSILQYTENVYKPQAFQPIPDSSSTSFHFHFILSMQRRASQIINRLRPFRRKVDQGSGGTPQIALSKKKTEEIEGNSPNLSDLPDLPGLSKIFRDKLKNYAGFESHKLQNVLEMALFYAQIIKVEADEKNLEHYGHKITLKNLVLYFLSKAFKHVKNIEQTIISNDEEPYEMASALVCMNSCAELIICGQSGCNENLPLVKVQRLPDLNSDESSTHTKPETMSDDFNNTVLYLLKSLNGRLDSATTKFKIPTQLTTTISLDGVIMDIDSVVGRYNKLASIKSTDVVKITTEREDIGLGFTIEIHDVKILEKKSGDEPKLFSLDPIPDDQEEGQ
ncbi:hypothetical protein H4219_005566 [Mycoemilia scoparia]|uniref:Uncharacterized protein n=1 Tax=Mycoemilia scoparia TaxID=417184 RepID=A0A9W8DP97_9FUNG|nr:hypothetical protein H4219_005566 [Mycoemilia scoparia]